MSRFILGAFLYFCFIPLSLAQDFSVGVRGGINQYSIGDINSRGGSFESGHPDEVFSPKKKIGYQFGAYVNIQFNKFFIRPEINYSKSKNSYDFPDKESYWKSSKIEIPVLFGYEIFKPVSIYAGPIFNFYGDTTLDGVQVTSYSDGGPDLDDTTMNLVFGVMAKYGRFGLDLRYEYGLKETEEELLDIIHSSYGVNLADLRSYRPGVLSLSLSIDIFRTNPDDIGGLFSGLFRSDHCYCPYN
ncbi:porin family protein [Mangrovimonas aestuarii]|uniref:porin family protein n=1 Tax=Mangrovimonas aestuarii TaxID=3018443 RepID=UPI002378B56B|nr:porin family protein [Mangrovimonas aestuarii]